MKLNFEQVRKLLPQRFPILMIDSVIDCEPGQSLTAIKAISGSDPVLQGHYPNFAIFPGVYLIETMAQASSLLAYCSKVHEELGGDDSWVPLLTTVDKVRFRAPVVPGMLLHIDVRLKGSKLRSVFFDTTITCGDKRICNGSISCSLAPLDALNGQ